MPPIRPSGQPGDARPPAQAHVQAQGAWFTVPELAFGADLLSLDATLVDRTPGDPLTPLVPGSYDVKVHAADVRVDASQVRDALRKVAGAELRRHGVSDVDVAFLPGGRVRVSGALQRLGVGWPVRLDLKLERRDANHVAVVPQLAPLTRWAMQRLGLDLAQPLAGRLPGVGQEPGGALVLDLRRLPYVQAQVQDLVTEDGKLRLRLGPPGARPPEPEARQGAKHWVQLEARGEVSVPDANLRNGRVFVRGTEEDHPIYLNDVPRFVTVRREAGEVVLTRDSLVTALKDRVPELALRDVRFEGEELHLAGVYKVPGGVLTGLVGLLFGGARGFVAGVEAGAKAKELEVPVRETLRLAVTPEGNLRLTPRPDSVHAGTIRDELAKLVGARVEGDGVVLDFSKLGELEVGRIRGMRTERGQLVLSF